MVARYVPLFGVVLWAGGMAYGWRELLRHDMTPGAAGTPVEHWPLRQMKEAERPRRTLLFFAHRNCPCTRAGLKELVFVLAQASSEVAACVVLVAPSEGAADRIGADVESQARAIPGVEVRVDPVGEEAKRFGVRTSGHVVLYGGSGRLLFSGGITASRGHAGESLGRQRLLAFLQGAEGETCEAPVFGCPLFADE